MDKYDALKLENQLCFPLYAAAREVVKKYHPFLSQLDLTYTQYIALMILWDKEKISVSELGKKMYLDSGTLTPLLKNLEKKGYITRNRSAQDERVLIASITSEGMALREKCLDIPTKVGCCIPLEQQEAVQLYQTLHKLLDIIEK